MSKMKRYKVIAEYPRYYLAEDDLRFKECFQKVIYKPDEEGYIYKNLPSYEGHPNPPQSINRVWGNARISEKGKNFDYDS